MRGILFTIFLVWSYNISYALDLTLTGRLQAGIDPATRDFVNNLPEVWRPKLNALTNDVMNRVDFSVSEYILRFQSALNSTIITAHCNAVGAAKTTIENLKSQIPGLSADTPMHGLYEYRDKQEKILSSNSSVDQVKVIYDDIAFKASVVACQNFAVPTAIHDANGLVGSYAERWLPWNRVSTIKCTTVKNCIIPYKNEIDKMIASADKRDVDKSDASKSLVSVIIPDPKWWQSSPVFSEYEVAVQQLYKIENSLGAARAEREIEAINKLKQFNDQVDSFTNSINNTRNRNHSFGIWVIVVPSQNGQACRMMWGPQLNGELSGARQGLINLKNTAKDITDVASIVEYEVKNTIIRADQQISRISSPDAFCP